MQVETVKDCLLCVVPRQRSNCYPFGALFYQCKCRKPLLASTTSHLTGKNMYAWPDCLIMIILNNMIERNNQQDHCATNQMSIQDGSTLLSDGWSDGLLPNVTHKEWRTSDVWTSLLRSHARLVAEDSKVLPSIMLNCRKASGCSPEVIATCYDC